MNAVDPVLTGGWRAYLRLGFDREDGRTRLAARRHEGPLVVQKPLYPEGGDVCQVIVVHPPGGIAGGDLLRLEVALARGARAQITTPGAAKWYRGFGQAALQAARLTIDAGACCEWLPQESIVFDGAEAEIGLEVEVAEGATYCGWEFVCLGRPAGDAPFQSGRLRQRTRITRRGVPLFHERALVEARSPLRSAPGVLDGRCAYGTLIVAGPAVPKTAIDRAREVVDACATAGVTAMGSLLVARWVGDRVEDGRALFTSLWAALRPWYAQRMAVVPRIWST